MEQPHGARRRCGSAAWALAGVLVVASAPASATLLVYEPFDYTTGLLEGRSATGLDLTGVWQGTAATPTSLEPEVASPGLGYGSLVGAPPAAGNRLSQNTGTTAGTASAQLAVPIDLPGGSAVYFSALFRLDDSENGNHLAHITLSDPDNGDSITFGEAVVGVRNVRISAETATTGGLIAGGADQFTNGQILFLVARYVNGAAAQSDSIELVGYDTAHADVLPQDFDPNDPNAEMRSVLTGVDIDLVKIGRIGFSIRGDANNFLDELRVGTTYAAVVPEPSTAALLLAGLAGLALRARRPGAARGAA
jgi:hypothetical protein